MILGYVHSGYDHNAPSQGQKQMPVDRTPVALWWMPWAMYSRLLISPARNNRMVSSLTLRRGQEYVNRLYDYSVYTEFYGPTPCLCFVLGP